MKKQSMLLVLSLLSLSSLAEIPQGYYYEGELTITKKVLKGSAPYGTDQVFYAAVYTDKNYTEQYGDLITLNMDGAETLSVTVPVSLGADPECGKQPDLADGEESWGRAGSHYLRPRGERETEFCEYICL